MKRRNNNTGPTKTTLDGRFHNNIPTNFGYEHRVNDLAWLREPANGISSEERVQSDEYHDYLKLQRSWCLARWAISKVVDHLE